MKNLLRISLFFVLLGCEKAPISDEALSSLKSGIDQAAAHLSPMAQSMESMTTEQLAKVIRYEYRVFDLPAGASAPGAEVALNEVGKDRWECFAVVPGPDGARVYCRRFPYALLQHALRVM